MTDHRTLIIGIQVSSNQFSQSNLSMLYTVDGGLSGVVVEDYKEV